MVSTCFIRKRHLLVATVMLVLSTALGGLASASASTMKTWTGASTTSTNWSDPANWSGGVPVSGDALIFPPDVPFDPSTRIAATFNDIEGLTLKSLTFPHGALCDANPLYSFRLSGQLIRITEGIDAHCYVVFHAPVYLSADQTWSLSFGLFYGSISGPGGIRLYSGDAVFIGDNTYTGPTTVYEATLEIIGNQPSSPVLLATGGASLQGRGGTSGALTSRSYSNVDLNYGLRHTVSGLLALDYGGLNAMFWDTGTGAPTLGMLDVKGTVNLGTASLNVSAFPPLSHQISAGDAYTVLNNDGSDPINGIFRNGAKALPEGAVFTGSPGGDPISFRISYRGGDGNDVTLSRVDSDDGGGGGEGRSYVALGDSYSSGEGNPPFLIGTDTRGNRCHRSVESYPYKIRPNLRPVHVACSGATIYDITNPNFEGNVTEGPQLNSIDSNTTRITISIGGNDTGFEYVLRRCSSGGDCSRDPKLNRLLQKRLNWLTTGHGKDCDDPVFLAAGVCAPPSDSLSVLYGKIASRAAPGAKIIVLNYPSLFGRMPTDACRNGILWSGNEQAWINIWGLKVNRAIKLQVDAARAANVNVQLADVWTTFGDHGVCSAEPWITGLTLRPPATPSLSSLISPYSFHPTPRGQDAMAEAVRRVF